MAVAGYRGRGRARAGGSVPTRRLLATCHPGPGPARACALAEGPTRDVRHLADMRRGVLPRAGGVAYQRRLVRLDGARADRGADLRGARGRSLATAAAAARLAARRRWLVGAARGYARQDPVGVPVGQAGDEPGG